MIVIRINHFEMIKKMRTKFVVRIFFDRKLKEFDSFFLSEKQYNKLYNTFNKMYNSSVKNTFVLAVFDGDRFVWPGIEYPDYSDQEWLEKTFNAVWSDSFVKTAPKITHYAPEKIEPINNEPDKDLIR